MASIAMFPIETKTFTKTIETLRSMLDINTLKINTIGYKEGLCFFDVSYDLDNELIPEKRLLLMETDDLEYVWLLLKQDFSYINAQVRLFPYPNLKDAYWNLFSVFRFRMENMDVSGEWFAWSNLLQDVNRDFTKRRSTILRNPNDETALRLIISDVLEEFEPEDRQRLELSKLEALVLFVYDYCMLSLRESILDPNVGPYITDYIIIEGTRWKSSRSINQAIKKYLKDPYEVLNGTTPDGNMISQITERQCLDFQQYPAHCQNPKATDSNVAAMFIDLMHRFFVAFGIKRRGRWGRAEKILLYELLQFFGLCNSKKKALDSTYINTLAHEHGSYFADCDLHSWIRDKDQPYSYLLSCGVHPLFDTNDKLGGDIIHPEMQGASPITIQESYNDMVGTITCTNASHPFICFFSAEQDNGESSTERAVPDPELSYVMKLIEENFLFVSFFPTDPKYFVVRKDLRAPSNWNKVLDELTSRFSNADNILRENVDRKDSILHAISTFREMHAKEDRKIIDTGKLYFLFLFIYDYVMFTYKEAALRMEIKRYINSTVEVNGELLPSTALIDDMLREYLLHPYTIQKNNGKCYRFLRDEQLYVPNVTPVIAHPSACVVNMTAMFYDLFARFFSSFGLSKRKGAKISELEKDLIARLAFLSGIGNSDKGTTVASIYSKNREYFIKSQLAISIRENEYWHLMLNVQEEELFGSPYHQKQ